MFLFFVLESLIVAVICHSSVANVDEDHDGKRALEEASISLHEGASTFATCAEQV
jgi:hypothetical protein